MEKVPARADEGWGKVLFPGPLLVVFWIWNYVTNVYTAVFVSTGLVLAVGAYLLKEQESDD